MWKGIFHDGFTLCSEVDSKSQSSSYPSLMGSKLSGRVIDSVVIGFVVPMYSDYS